MSEITFEQFKGYFEFGLEVTGLAGVVATAAYKLKVAQAFWRIAHGRAKSRDERLAMEALQNGGEVAQQVIEDLADNARSGNPAMARRLDEIREAVSRPVSPGQMV
jgi:hypothetical protein